MIELTQIELDIIASSPFPEITRENIIFRKEREQHRAWIDEQIASTRGGGDSSFTHPAGADSSIDSSC